MDAETYEMIQEMMVREAIYRNEREMNRQRGDTYRARAIALSQSNAILRSRARVFERMSNRNWSKQHEQRKRAVTAERRGNTYHRRALCLTWKLANEHEHVRCANRVAEKMRIHAGQVEQELADALAVNESLAALLRRAYHELLAADGVIRREQDRPDPQTINDIRSRVVPCSLPTHAVGKE